MISSVRTTRLRLLGVMGLCILLVSVVSAASVDSHGMTYFPSDHVWNYPITSLPVHQYSAHWIQGISDYSIGRCTAGTFCYSAPVNVWAYAEIPINWVNSSVKHTNVTTWRNQDGPWGNSDKIAAPFTPTLKVQDDSGQDDNVLIIVDTDEKKAYEFFQAAKAADNTWSCNGEFVWNLTNDYRIQPDPVAHPPYGLASVSASGVPVIAGMIKYDELNAGHIDHAVGGIIGRVNYSTLWPGSHRPPENQPQSDNTFPPYSARLRLKSSVDTSSMGTQAKTIAEALKTYGVIIRDRGSVGLSLSMEEDSRFNPYGTNMSGLHNLKLDDFEFVDESSLEINPSTAQVRTGSPVVVTPVPSFTSNVTAGTPPTIVQFTDTSANTPTSWAWTFGDGGTSTLKNPSHQYTTAGTYSVTLKVSNAGGSNTLTRTNYISVTSVAPPVAGFTGTPTSGVSPLTAAFTDASTNSPASWVWTFGDGGTSTLKNPSHQYTTAGTYDGDPEGIERRWQQYPDPDELHLGDPVAPPVAGFTGTPTSGSWPAHGSLYRHVNQLPGIVGLDLWRWRDLDP